MANWFKRNTDGQVLPGEEPNDFGEFKPDEFKKDITSSFERTIGELKAEQANALKPVNDMLAEMQRERAEREEAKRRVEQSKSKEDNEIKDEDWLVDPDGAVDKKLKQTNMVLLQLAGRAALRETLENEEYYHGEIKQKVDAMVTGMPLAQQSNPASIMNCYKIAMYDNRKAIEEGKIKAKNSAAIFEGGSTGGHGGRNTEGDTETLTAEEKQVAKVFGMNEKEWISSRKELSYV